MAKVVAVASATGHRFSKRRQLSIRLVAGHGVQGDAHAGATVKHRSRVARDPNQPNLRQVHLIHAELFDELAEEGYAIGPGDLGENITTSGLDLLRLPAGTRLRIGETAVVAVTGLRNPCVQIERFRPGLLKAVLGLDAGGRIIRKTGVMGIVMESGDVLAGDAIASEAPEGRHLQLEVV